MIKYIEIIWVFDIMLCKVIRPSDILQKYINCYYVFETNSLSEFSAKQRVYPYGCVILVFHYNQPYHFQKRDELVELEPRTVICGQQTTYYDLTPLGKTGMVFIVFKPYGAGLFFKMPMNEITNKNIAFKDIVNKEADEIEDKIQNASSTDERIGILDNYLVQKLIQNYTKCDQIIDVFKKINQSNGQISITELANKTNIGIKQMERKFSKLVGIKPKKYLQTFRFQYTLRILKKKRFFNFTPVAFECGYYDQSHFINDFKSFTGLAPRAFFKEIRSL